MAKGPGDGKPRPSRNPKTRSAPVVS